MTRSVPLFLLCILFPAIQAARLTKCEVAQAIKDLDGYQDITLPECEFATLVPCLIPLLTSPLMPRVSFAFSISL